MLIWLLKDGEPLPIKGSNERFLRMGMIANYLVEAGHEVVWWTSTWDHNHKRFRFHEDTTIQVSPTYQLKLLHSYGYKKNISFRRFVHQAKVAKKFLSYAKTAEKPDLIFVALPTIELADAATRYGKEQGIPVILDLRDMWPDIMVDIIPKPLQWLARLSLTWQFAAMRRACQNATALIGITEGFLQWGLGYANRPRNQWDAVYYMAYSEKEPSLESLKEAQQFWSSFGLGETANEFVMVFVGSMRPTHQLKPVIEAAKRLKGKVKLVIAGEGDLLPMYKKLAQSYDNIIFPGWIQASQIWVLLKLAKIGLAPYVHKSYFQSSITNKPVEYLSAGLPVLTTVEGTLSELLKKEQCGYYYPAEDVDQLINYIEQFLSNPELLKQMSQRAKETYCDSFVAEKVYQDMVCYLEKIRAGFGVRKD